MCHQWTGEKEREREKEREKERGRANPLKVKTVVWVIGPKTTTRHVPVMDGTPSSGAALQKYWGHTTETSSTSMEQATGRLARASHRPSDCHLAAPFVPILLRLFDRHQMPSACINANALTCRTVVRCAPGMLKIECQFVDVVSNGCECWWEMLSNCVQQHLQRTRE